MARLALVVLAAAVLAGCAGSRVQAATPDPLDMASGIVPADAAVLAPTGTGLVFGSDSDPDCFPPPAPCPPAPPLPPQATTVAAAADEAPAGAPPAAETAPVPSSDEVVDEIAPPPPAAEDAPMLGSDCCGKPNCGCKKTCCPPCWGNKRCGGYGGFSAAVWPGLGAGMHFGINYYMDERVLWSYDFGLVYQDANDDFVGGEDLARGKFSQFRVGIRGRFNPCCSRWHPTLRLGLGWTNATGRVDLHDSSKSFADFPTTGDYFGAYFGVGLEYDINHRWSTGPEVSMFNGYNFDDDEYAYSFTLFWHFTYKF